jgi:hypothetical protein
MIIDPVSAGVGVLSAGLGIFQGIADSKARQQQYLNESAFAGATGQFNQWQAKKNVELQNLNNTYGYWRDTVAHNQQLAYTSQLRGYEFAKELTQLERVMEARSGAGTQYTVTAEAIQQALQERGMQEAVALQQYSYRALQASAAYQAAGQEGQSMDRYVANFARQAGDYNALQQINQQFQQRQYKRDQLGALTTYLNQYNSQQFYERTPYMDPVAPFPPLPTMIMPPPPSMKGGKPGGVSGLTIAGAVLGGVNAYMNTSAQIKQLGG